MTVDGHVDVKCALLVGDGQVGASGCVGVLGWVVHGGRENDRRGRRLPPESDTENDKEMTRKMTPDRP